MDRITKEKAERSVRRAFPVTIGADLARSQQYHETTLYRTPLVTGVTSWRIFEENATSVPASAERGYPYDESRESPISP
jgi:hypothetical protein